MWPWLYPELHLFKDHFSRARAWSRVWGKRGYKQYCSPLRASVVLLPILALLLLALALLGALPLEVAYVGIPALVIATIVTPATFLRTAIRRGLRHELAVAAIPICLHCGYDIAHITRSECPECGTPIPDAGTMRPLVREIEG